MKPELSPKQQRFVKEYLIDFNGTQAAIRAGYSKHTANEQAARLLANVSVRSFVERESAKAGEKFELKKEFVIKGLLAIVGRCMQARACMEFDKVEKEYIQKTDADGNLVYEFEAPAAVRAFELLGKHLGMFTEKVEHSGQVNEARLYKIVIGGAP